MATITRYVNTASTAGGDGTTNATTGANRAYASMNEWETNEQTDLVTDADIHVVYCTGTAADTTAVDIDGWTTGASNDITINGELDGPAWNTSLYRLSLALQYQGPLTIREDFITANNLQIEQTGSYGDTGNGITYHYATASAVITINACYIRHNNVTASTGYGLYPNPDGTNHIINTVVDGFDRGVYLPIAAGGETNLYNNTLANQESYGIYASGYPGSATTYNEKNNLIQGAGTADYYHDFGGNVTATYSTNLSSDTSSENTTLRSKTVTFDGADDYHTSDTDSVDQGTDLSSDTYYAFSVDNDGDTRTGSWDIGADEYVAAAGGTTLQSSLTLLGVGI